MRPPAGQETLSPDWVTVSLWEVPSLCQCLMGAGKALNIGEERAPHLGSVVVEACPKDSKSRRKREVHTQWRGAAQMHAGTKCNH